MLPSKLRLIFASGSREEDFLEINQSEIKMVCCGHVCNRIGTNLAIVIGNFPYIHPTKFRFIWQNGFRGEVFRNWPIRNNNCLWQPCLLTNQDEISNLYRELSKDASYLIVVHLVQQFQRRTFFRNRPIRNKNCLCRPYFLMDRDKMSNPYRGPSIDASYQVSVHMAEGFQRRRSPVAAMFVNGSGRNEQSL